MPDPLADELRLRLALKAAQQGAWEFDLGSGRGYRSPELVRLLGVGNASPTFEEYLSNVHQDDRPAILSAFAELRTGRIDESTLQYRLLRDDAQLIWVEQHTYAERGERGEVFRLYGLSKDVTSARQTELALQELNAILEVRVAERTRELESERTALDAFAAFTETAGSQIDAVALAQHAADVLRQTLGEVSVSYYELEGALWRARVCSDDMAPEIVQVLVAGIPVGAPSYREAVESKTTVFVPGWNAASEGVAQTETYGAGAFYPCFVDDQPQGLLAMGTRRAGDWTLREQTVFRSVGRSLTLALERADAALKLREQNLELAARTRALEGFADLTRDLSLRGEPYGLVRRAQEVMMSLLPAGVAFY